MSRTLFSCTLAALAAAAIAQQQLPFTYHDLITLDRPGSPAVDATGTQLLYTVRASDLAKNKGVNSLWRMDLRRPARPAVRLAVSDSGATGAQWGPEGRIYFLRAHKGVMQVWRTDTTGTTAEQVTHLPLDVQAYRPAPDGRGLVVALAVFPDAQGDEVQGTATKLNEQKTGDGTVYDRLFVRHWDTWADGTRNHLFYLPFSGGVPVALTQGFDGDIPGKPFGDEGDFWIAPDAHLCYFSARVAGTTEPWSTNFDVYSVPLTGGRPTDLTADNKAWDASPRVSPDGRMLAYKAMRRPGFEADRFALVLRDVATGRTTPLAPTWDRSVDDMLWSTDGQSLYVTADDLGAHRLFRVDVHTGTVTPLTGTGHMDAFIPVRTNAKLPDGFVYQRSALNDPGQLYWSAPAAPRKKGPAPLLEANAVQLTHLNAVLATRTFGAYEQFHFPGWNNETVYGYVMKPANYQEGRKYPVAFLIHGGPQGSFGDAWSYRWNAETYAGAGYAVVMIDFHGSTGYGQAFTDAISTHWGDRPLEDLQKGWAYAQQTYPFLDAGHAAALGASYGGFMVNWIAGHWKAPWKCLVSHDGVFDARAMGYTTEELWFEDWEQGGPVLKTPAAYDTFNPALSAKDWSVPMLIVHSDLDYRIPVEQGIAAFTALQANGTPSRLLRFPDENHWVLKPQNSLQWHTTVFDWLEKYIGK